jgi:WD40 repeat protein
VSESRTPSASVVERTQPVAAGTAVVAIHFLRNTAVFVRSEETLLFAGKDGEARRAQAHGGAILAAASDGDFVITGGDDGKVMVTNAQGEAGETAADPKRRWIDRVAAGPDSAIAWSAGKQAFVKTAKGEERTLDLPSSVGGLAFAPKGFRLGVAHYGGATLWFPNARDARPEFLEWKGSHLDVAFSPDGRFLVTSMQEPTLHGWRVVDAKHMRMSGYAARVRSMSWTADGKALATSGSNQLIVWPFQSKDGPMGKTPRMLAPYEHNACAVACHPKQEVIAVGYEDGLVLLVRMPDGAEILAKKPGNAPVTALAWNATGNLVAFGTEDGEAGIISLG